MKFKKAALNKLFVCFFTASPERVLEKGLVEAYISRFHRQVGNANISVACMGVA